MKRFIFQAATAEDHLSAVKSVLTLAKPKTIILSTAFMTRRGLSLIEAEVQAAAKQTKLYVGIRNGVTTVQAIQKALEIGVETYLVDTGSASRIFHPKMYYGRTSTGAMLNIGSANLTVGGMITNIEASVSQSLDAVSDAALLKDIEDKFENLVSDHPKNVFRAKPGKHLRDLFDAGHLADERKARASGSVGSSSDRDLDDVPKMSLKTRPPKNPSAKVPAPKSKVGKRSHGRAGVELVWESKGLSERDLSIPSGASTSPTGSMLFKLGAWENIDHQFYFRDEVFDNLAWNADANPTKSHWERAAALFRLIIKGIDYGEFMLKLSHDTRDTAKIRKARNSKTQLHWGDAKPLIAKRDLLHDCALRLFRDSNDPTKFRIEID